jgi:dihydrofolate synthase / folylpolyglutamate synthase
MTSRRSLDEWLRIQETVHGQGIDLGLVRVRGVAERMQLLPVAARSIIVAGTNGKGSTVANLEALARAHGLCVGAFTSPHLLRYNERIRVDSAEASDIELVAAFEAIEAARGDTTLTFFEFNALAALEVFRARKVDIAVLEVGLGGRLDAVNIVDADAAIVCSIGLDHADWLGTDIAGIGREKAGVFRAGKIAVLADPDMTAAVCKEAQRIGAQIVAADVGYSYSVDQAAGLWSFHMGELHLLRLPAPGLPGSRQYANSAAALATLHAMGIELEQRAVSTALQGLLLPGRFQIIPGPVEWILDVAHNEAAAVVLAGNLHERPCAGRTWAVTAILGDKDISAVAQALAPSINQWVVCGNAAPRGLTADQLVARSPVFSAAMKAEDIQAGMRMAAAGAQAGDRIVVCGSFLAVAPAMALLGLF